jgi:hypothetical protein
MNPHFGYVVQTGAIPIIGYRSGILSAGRFWLRSQSGRTVSRGPHTFPIEDHDSQPCLPLSEVDGLELQGACGAPDAPES